MTRFWAKVNKTDYCWLWTACKDKDGYGSFWYKGDMRPAHRIVYEFTYGGVSQGKLICHHCDNPSCVNPTHLFLGSHKDNAQDMLYKGRNSNQNKNKTHCIHGHELAGYNLMTVNRGTGRRCRICHNRLTAESKRRERVNK